MSCGTTCTPAIRLSKAVLPGPRVPRNARAFYLQSSWLDSSVELARFVRRAGSIRPSSGSIRPSSGSIRPSSWLDSSIKLARFDRRAGSIRPSSWLDSSIKLARFVRRAARFDTKIPNISSRYLCLSWLERFSQNRPTLAKPERLPSLSRQRENQPPDRQVPELSKDVGPDRLKSGRLTLHLNGGRGLVREENHYQFCAGSHAYRFFCQKPGIAFSPGIRLALPEFKNLRGLCGLGGSIGFVPK